ncbi:MAG: hypothetical protein FD123_2765 [Bacteroidetes bacterium]|nr:MAG: hypothetical protein FD123_2765 [Bacteroidota bacterium]
MTYGIIKNRGFTIFEKKLPVTQGQLIAQLMDNTRDLVHFYSSKIEEEHWMTRPEMNGVQMNSTLWTMAHLAWAQNFLILKGCSARDLGRDWMELFAIRKEMPADEHVPAISEIRLALDDIHKAAVEVVSALSEEELAEPNNLDAKFKRGNTKLQIISHHLRHEGCHIGHLGWLAKTFGAKTV